MKRERERRAQNVINNTPNASEREQDKERERQETCDAAKEMKRHALGRRRAREERHVRAPSDAGECRGTKGDDDGGDALLRGTSDARLELERWQILAHLFLQRNAAARLLDRGDHERRRIGRRHRRLLGRAVALLAVLGLLWRRGGAQAAQINSAARHRACAEQRCARRKQ